AARSPAPRRTRRRRLLCTAGECPRAGSDRERARELRGAGIDDPARSFEVQGRLPPARESVRGADDEDLLRPDPAADRAECAAIGERPDPEARGSGAPAGGRPEATPARRRPALSQVHPERSVQRHGGRREDTERGPRAAAYARRKARSRPPAPTAPRDPPRQ